MLDLQNSDFFVLSGLVLPGLIFLLSTWVLLLARNRSKNEEIKEIQIVKEPDEVLDDITALNRQSQYDLDELLAITEQIAETETVLDHEQEHETAPNPEDDELLAIIEQIAENERTSAVADDDELFAALEQIAENERNANTVINDGRLAAELQQIIENERAERLVGQEDDEYIAIAEQFREYETDLNADNDRPVIPREQIPENDVAGHPDGARNDVEVENQNDLNTFECGCCDTEFNLDERIRCGGGHICCKECARRTLAAKMEEGRMQIPCPINAECADSFERSEIEKFAPADVLARLDRIIQEDALRQAAIPGFHACPYCPYGAVIDDEAGQQNDLFFCMSPLCGKISCRKCKKEGHPDEVCKDSELSEAHKREEEETKKLVRNCVNPNCSLPYIKEAGCNKIVCTQCNTKMCYICRVQIADYSHFGASMGLCPLYDKDAPADPMELG